MTRTLLCFLFAAVSLTRAATFTWTGALNGQWTSGLNWGQGSALIVPAETDSLVFPAGAANKAMTNGYPVISYFWRLNFQDAGYSVSGNRFGLEAANGQQARLDVTHTGGMTNVLAVVIMEGATPVPPLIRVTGTGATLRLAEGLSAQSGGELNASGAGSLIQCDGAVNASSFSITGAGLVRLNANSIGDLEVAGHAELNAVLSGRVTVAATGTLSGDGIVDEAAEVQGDLDPGGSNPGALNFNESLTFGTGTQDDLFFDIQGTVAGTSHDELLCLNAVAINGARLHLRAQEPFAVPFGTTLRLIDKRQDGPMTNGPFRAPDGTPLPEGAITVQGFQAWRISYAGGTGNDLTATLVAAPSSGLFAEWDGGGGAANGVSNGLNWLANATPTAADTLLFGGLAQAANRSPVVDATAPNFHALQFAAGGYLLTHSQTLGSMVLSNGITTTHTTGVNTVDIFETLLAAPQRIAVNGAGGILFRKRIAGGGHALEISVAQAAATAEFESVLLDLDGLTKNGPGRLLFSGSGANSYAGTTTVNRGELRITRTAAGNVIPGALVIGDGGGSASVVSTGNEKIADSATVGVNSGASFQPVTETIASLNLNGGAVNSGSGTLTISNSLSAQGSSTIAGTLLRLGGSGAAFPINGSGTVVVSAPVQLTGSATSISKNQSGHFRFTGSLTAPAINVAGGRLTADGTTAASVALASSTSVLAGSGRVGNISSASSSAAIAPDDGASPYGILETGNLAFSSGQAPVIRCDLGTGAADYDSLSAIGTVNLANAVIQINDAAGAPPARTEILLIRNDGADPIAGTFAGLPAGANIVTTKARYHVSYTGGTGNDVVLTVIAAPVGPPRITSFEVVPASPGHPARISAGILGPALIAVELQTSTDLGAGDPWQTIHTFTLNSSGSAILLDIPDPSATEPNNFWRFRYP